MQIDLALGLAEAGESRTRSSRRPARVAYLPHGRVAALITWRKSWGSKEPTRQGCVCVCVRARACSTYKCHNSEVLQQRQCRRPLFPNSCREEKQVRAGALYLPVNVEKAAMKRSHRAQGCQLRCQKLMAPVTLTAGLSMVYRSRQGF